MFHGVEELRGEYVQYLKDTKQSLLQAYMDNLNARADIQASKFRSKQSQRKIEAKYDEVKNANADMEQREIYTALGGSWVAGPKSIAQSMGYMLDKSTVEQMYDAGQWSRFLYVDSIIEDKTTSYPLVSAHFKGLYAEALTNMKAFKLAHQKRKLSQIRLDNLKQDVIDSLSEFKAILGDSTTYEELMAEVKADYEKGIATQEKIESTDADVVAIQEGGASDGEVAPKKKSNFGLIAAGVAAAALYLGNK